MKNMKRILAVLLMVCMVLPLAVVTSFAEGETTDNWKLFGGKYSTASGYYNRAKLAKGYTLTANEGGTITVHSPSAAEYGNSTRSYSQYDITAITNENVTPLDNLSVTVKPGDGFTFTPNSLGLNQSLNMLWTVDHPVTLAQVTAAGSQDAVKTLPYFLHNEALTNGIRAVVLQPVCDDNGIVTTQGTKGLQVTVDGSVNTNTSATIASRVNIYLYDGSFKDVGDGTYGYRWSFTARNYGPHTPNGSEDPIYSFNERVETKDGLTFEVVPDTTLGYKVYVNGKDFSDGDQVGYFPNNTSYGVRKEYSDQDKLDSFTYARADIDLTSLVGLGNGYLTVGSTGVCATYGCTAYNYDIVSVNGVAATTWAGEANTHTHAYTTIEDIAATCVEAGSKIQQCTCGAVKTNQINTDIGFNPMERYSSEVIAVQTSKVLTSEEINAKVKEICLRPYNERLGLTDHEYNVGYAEYVNGELVPIDSSVANPLDCRDVVQKLEVCVNCEKTIATLLKGNGHIWSDWAYETEPSLFDAGEIVRSCERCGTQESMDVPSMMDDTYTAHWTVGTATRGGMLPAEGDFNADESGNVYVYDYAETNNDNAVKLPLTKATTTLPMSLDNFTVTMANIGRDMNDDGALEYNYSLSFIWTNSPNNYKNVNNYITAWGNKYNTKTYARFGNLWDNYVAGEYTLVFNLLDNLEIDTNLDGQCTSAGEMASGVAGDGYYDAIIAATVRNGDVYAAISDTCHIPMSSDITLALTSNEITVSYEIEDMSGELQPAEKVVDVSTVTPALIPGNGYHFGIASYGITNADYTNKGGETTINEDVNTPCSTSFVIKNVSGHAAISVKGEYASAAGDCEHIAGDPVIENVVAATCTEAGSHDEVTYCTECGEEMSCDPIVDEALGHSYDDGVVTTAPTGNTTGVKTYTCTRCDDTYTEDVAMTCDASAKNYTLVIPNAQDINYIRYASGVHTTSTSIRNAADLVSVSASLVQANVGADGTLRYELPAAGQYSFWVRYKTAEGGSSGPTYIFTLDFTYMEQEIEADGFNLTIKNLYGVKDCFIKKGTYETYSEIKSGYIVRITSANIAGAKNYKYAMSYTKGQGDYTLLVRYDDTTRANTVIHFNIDVLEPVVTTNGLQVTVGNLEGVKVIRSAVGAYTTPSQVKNASGCRNFTSKSVIKGADSYTIQYTTAMEGVNTLSIEYDNGYCEVVQVTIQHKAPTYAINGDTITFSNVDIDDLYIIRWAPGKVSKASFFKSTTGNKYAKITPNGDGTYKTAGSGTWDPVAKTFTITGLSGTYSFMVQYNEASQNIYTSLAFN